MSLLVGRLSKTVPSHSSYHAPGHRETYWPEIDGLRTIAVIAVFAFHLDSQLLKGGFVGVDIFFVISGYLITSLLINDILAGKFSVFKFYQRRIARIAPAALLVVAVTMVVGSLLYSAQDFSSLGSAGLAATLSLINFKLIFQGSYFKISPDSQPLIHYWSLAVEEQFYLIFPVFLLIITRFTQKILAALLICGTMSFIACAILTPLHPIAAFYLLPTRAWELLAGSSLAILKRQHPQFGERQSALYLPIGLSFIFLSFILIRSEGFPGSIAILPVTGSAFSLAGITSNRRGAIHRFLSHPIMVFIGKRSYSLYLWHWPIFSFIDYLFYIYSPITGIILKISISMLATLLSYRFVENPMRTWLNTSQKHMMAIVSFITAAFIVSAAGYTIRSNYYLNAESYNVVTGGISINPKGHKWVVLIGDSQGSMYGYELAALSRTFDFRLNILSVAAGNELPSEPNTLWPMVSQFLGNDKPDLIILAQAWSWKLDDYDGVHFNKAITTIANRAERLVMLTQPPEPPSYATRHAMLSGVRPPFFEDPATTKIRVRANLILHKLENERIKIIDIDELFLNNDNSIKLISSNWQLNYQDSDHLSEIGTKLTRPIFENFLRDELKLPS